MQTTFLKTFTNTQSFENVRVFGTVDKPLFMAKDVANMLKYRDTKKAIKDHVDEEDRFVLSHIDGGVISPPPGGGFAPPLFFI